jgi:predicted NBD/HSP70 family sugar kinase
MDLIIRVVESGGKGFRVVDVCGKQITNVGNFPNSQIKIDDLIFFVTQKTDHVSAFAFSVAGDVDSNGTVIKAPNIPMLNRIPLAELVRKATGKPVVVANDMTTATTGMLQLFPELAGCCLCETWSSGIGGRFVWNGQIVSSSEMSHIVLADPIFGQLCGCRLRGHVDCLLGGAGVTRRVLNETQMLGIDIPEDTFPCAFLDQSYVAGDEWARNIYHMIAYGMGKYLAILQSVIQFPAIIWKGSFAQNALRLPMIERQIRESMHSHLMNPCWERDLKFYFVPRPPEAIADSEAFLGAAALALKLCA